MSEIASSPNKIQIEATRFRAGVSSTVVQNMGASINYLLENLLPVGSVISTMLSEASYQSEAGTGWVLADGRDVTGSAYHTLTGNTTIPDLRGVYMRGRNHGRSTATGDSQGDAATGTFRADVLADHKHDYIATRLIETGDNSGDVESDAGSEIERREVFDTTADINPGANPGAESAPRSVIVNFMIRIN